MRLLLVMGVLGLLQLFFAHLGSQVVDALRQRGAYFSMFVDGQRSNLLYLEGDCVSKDLMSQLLMKCSVATGVSRAVVYRKEEG